MEELNNCKFSGLSDQEMAELQGGWGWHPIMTSYVLQEGADNGSTVIMCEYRNIWGNSTGEYKNVLD